MAPSSKRAKLSHPLPFSDGLFDRENIAQISSQYSNAQPFKHAVVDKLFQDNLLRDVKRECQKLAFSKKETDIYKILQTGDLASISLQPPEIISQLQCLLSLRNALYSPEFRSYIRKVTDCGPLSGSKQDMAVNSYTDGCHLLNHDDVIGSRRVSYILYMPIPEYVEWKKEWGGALELYPIDETGQPTCTPSKTIPPAWNQFVLFEVQPGLSHHSVEEVVIKGKRRERMSISGWFHKAQPGEDGYMADEITAHKSTREHLTSALPTIFQAYPILSPVSSKLSSQDTQFLSEYITSTYLTPTSIALMHTKFVEESHIQLTKFLLPEFASNLSHRLSVSDLEDGLSSTIRKNTIPSHSSGLSSGRWSINGPPHTRRYCTLPPELPDNLFFRDSEESLLSLELLFQSVPFRNWISLITGLTPTGVNAQARRFRPGLDYTLATGASEIEGGRIDVVLGCTPSEAWGDGECGGWECYIAPEDESTDPAVYKTSSRSTNSMATLANNTSINTVDEPTPDEPLLVLPPSFSSLHITLRDAGLMRFVKYVSAIAPGSRWDVCAEFTYSDDTNSSNE